MPLLCLQIHPNRAPDIDLAHIQTLVDPLATDPGLVAGFQVTEGDDEAGGYVNLVFDSPRPARLWAQLQQLLYGDTLIGLVLSGASLCMCQGEQGWDDYLLLHHFDPAMPLDDFAD